MAITAYNPCGTALGSFTPAGDCIEEGSGVLGLILIKKGFDIAGIVDSTTYTAAKTAKNIVNIKDIEAYWPKGTQQTVQGLAGRMARHGHWDFELPFKHEGVDANLVFWNTVNQNKNWGIAFVTEEYKVFAALDRDLEPVLAQVAAAPASDQEFGKTRFFEGSVKWKYKDLVQYADVFTLALIKPDFQV